MPNRLLQGSIVALLLLGANLATLADAYDNAAARARAISGDTVIKCSPTGGDGTLSVGEALRVLKPGVVLQLYPGTYESVLIISTDKVIIEGGTADRYCEVKIELGGKDCVIRKLWANHLELNRSAIVVDSVFNYICTPYDNTKVECVLYNSCCRAIYLGDERNSLAAIDSTVRQGADSCFALACRKSGTFKLRNSIIYATYIAMRVFGSPRVEIENCLIFGDEGLAKSPAPSAKKQSETAIDMASFRKLAKSRNKGENLGEKPVFKRSSSMDASLRIGYLDEDKNKEKIPGNGWFWTRQTEEAPDFYLLADDSPLIARGIGANLDKNGFPVPRIADGKAP
jgi:hypothetical protein